MSVGVEAERLPRRPPPRYHGGVVWRKVHLVERSKEEEERRYVGVWYGGVWYCGLCCGVVVLWCCGGVVVWWCGSVVVWWCGNVVVWRCGIMW